MAGGDKKLSLVASSIELAVAQNGSENPLPVKAEALDCAQAIPLKFLENILQGLRQAGLVDSRRGPDGGHRLARPAAGIALADIIHAIDGPLAGVGGRAPHELEYAGSAEPLRDVRIAVRASLRRVLEDVTLADLAGATVPPHVAQLTADPGAWEKR